MSADPKKAAKAYVLVFSALAVLTLLTVAVSYWHLPMAAAVVIGVAIASVKAGLVATYFMHLKGEKVLIYGLLLLTVFFLIFLMVVPMIDFRLTTPVTVSPAPSTPVQLPVSH